MSWEWVLRIEAFVSFVQGHVNYTVDSFSSGIALLMLAYLVDMQRWTNYAGLLAKLYFAFAGFESKKSTAQNRFVVGF
eukprot:6472240-Amphidinium_carterae.1